MNNVTDMRPGDSDRRAGTIAARAVALIAAVAVICFCGWSAYEYANGRDPLAFLGGSALKTVAEEPATTIGSPDAPDASDEVSAALGKLSFDGEDVSVTPKDCTVAVRGGCAWVESRDGDAATDMVSATARRAAALAQWASTADCGVTSVVWISEDHAGTVRMTLTLDVASAPAKGDAAAILAAARGYAISADAYASLGDAPGFERTGGMMPQLPDGSSVPVPTKTSEAGERLAAEDAATAMGSLVVGSSTSKSGAAASQSSSTGTSAGESESSTIVVVMTVDGSAAGAGSSTATVEVPRGSSVYDALAASGVAYEARGTQFGTYVSSICGLAEKAHGGMSGWVYAVNNVQVNTACSNCTLSNGDRISWVYVNVTE